MRSRRRGKASREQPRAHLEPDHGHQHEGGHHDAEEQRLQGSLGDHLGMSEKGVVTGFATTGGEDRDAVANRLCPALGLDGRDEAAHEARNAGDGRLVGHVNSGMLVDLADQIGKEGLHVEPALTQGRADVVLRAHKRTH